MSYRLLGTLLLLLPGAASVEKTQVQQSPRELRVRPGQKVELSCSVPEHNRQVTWYKEKPGGGLLVIYRQPSFSRPMGKYSGRMEKLWNFSFTISPAQREDSGVYYCSFLSPPRQSPQFGDGTRLIVTDATEPKLSILVPVDSEEPGQPPANIPVLCHLYDVPPGWNTVKWQPGGEVTPVTAATMDDQGVLSAWSITWVPAERWDGAAACTATENSTGRTLGVAIEGCPSWPLALGLSCVSLLLLLQVSILLCRRRLAGADPPADPCHLCTSRPARVTQEDSQE